MIFALRSISFAIVWGIGMAVGVYAGLSQGDWAERFAARCGGDPDEDGIALRFLAMCFGVFIMPMLHIAIWELVL